jgi:SAM-dependent methyltransferase
MNSQLHVSPELSAPPLQDWTTALLDKCRRELEAVDQFDWDRLRFGISLQWIESLALPNGSRVLELGSAGVFSGLMAAAFPGLHVEHWHDDLRNPIGLPNETFDLIIAMEVIEHIADSPMGHGITLAGMETLLAECQRLILPGGALFITTPNATSVWTIQRALLGQPPMLHEQHVRELAPAELATLVRGAGLVIETHECFTVWHMWDFTPILDFMRLNGYSLRDRGDDQFLLARRLR